MNKKASKIIAMFVLSLIVSGVLLGANSAYAVGGSTIVYPEADTVEGINDPASNWDSNFELYIGKTKWGEDYKSALRFDLSSISRNVTDAKLRVYIDFQDSNSSDLTINLYKANDDAWAETVMPDSGDRIAENIPVNSDKTWIEVSVTDYINAEVNGDGKASFVLGGATTSDDGYIVIFSREILDQDYYPHNPPQLVVTCEDSQYSVIYDGNASTGGSVPNDINTYYATDTVTVLGNTGSLEKTGYTFSGWNTEADGSGNSLRGRDTFTIGTSNVTLYALYNVNQYTVTFDSSGGSTVDPVTADFGSLITAPTIPTKTGYDFGGWYREAGLTTEWDFGTDTVPASDIKIYGKWNRISSGGSSSGSSSNSDSKASDVEAGSNGQEDNTMVLVNGQEEKAGIESVTEEPGEKIVEFKLDSDIINAKIEEVIRSQSQDIGETQSENIIEVPILTQDAKNMTTILTGDIVKKMDDNNFNLSIKSEKINYVIPAKEVGIESVAKNLGVAVENLKEIEIEVQINKVDEKVTKEIEERAKSKNYEIIFPPMSFEVVAKTRTSSGEEKQLTVSKFNQYVQRVMELPEGVDQSKITTGIFYNEDGAFHTYRQVYL